MLFSACAALGDGGVPDPDKAADSHAGAGLYLIGAGRLEQARRRLERSLQIDPEHPQATAGMGLVAEGEGEFEQAVDYHRKAAKLAKDSASEPERGPILNNLGRVLCRLGKVDEALSELESASQVAGYSSRHVPLTNAARCALDAERYSRAEAFLAAALAQEEGFAPALLVRAELSFVEQRFSAAAEDLERVREIDRSPRTLFFSARVAEELGNREAAQAYAHELRERFPRSDYAGRLDADQGGMP